jgi:hypothetical protein
MPLNLKQVRRVKYNGGLTLSLCRRRPEKNSDDAILAAEVKGGVTKALTRCFTLTVCAAFYHVLYFRKQRLVEDAGVVDSSGPSMIVDEQSSTCHAPPVIYMTSGTKKRGQLFRRRVLITRPARAAHGFAPTTVCAITKAHKIRPDDGMCHRDTRATPNGGDWLACHLKYHHQVRTATRACVAAWVARCEGVGASSPLY